jgi:cytochrome c oxidase subunit 2
MPFFRAPWLPVFGLVAAPFAPQPVGAAGPMFYLESVGPRGQAIADLTIGLLVLSIVVVVAVSLLVLLGAWRRRTTRPYDHRGQLPVARGGNGVRWMFIGLALTIVALVGSVTWTMVTMGAINQPSAEPQVTIEVTGHQWWWQVRYISDDPSRQFETANEIHIPVGEAVRLRLRSADVIHTFWVPAVSGKTDLIPGRTNITWLQADQPGTYRGQCNEYCGEQHAHMALDLIAQSSEAFEAWWDEQLEPAAPPETESVGAGQQQFALRCAVCHSVRGTSAGGKVGPDLTHLMSRETLAAGMLPNTVANLSGWIANPQVIKPGSKMPNLELSGPELDQIRTYLATLE